LIGKVLQRELPGQHAFGFLDVHLSGVGSFCLLDQAEHIAHSKDPGRDTGGVENFQRVQSLTSAEELDRNTSHFADGDGCAAPGVAVDLGKDQAAHWDHADEALRNIQCFLPDHRVHHQQDFLNRHRFIQGFEFVHQGIIQLRPSCCIQDHNRIAAFSRDIQRAFGDLHRFCAFYAVYWHVNALAQGLQLLNGCRAVNVRCYHQDSLAP